MARDDFSKSSLDTLAKRVGVRCSNPSCRKLTTGPRTDSQCIVNIGVGAHITAAAPGGPRYNPSLMPEQRQSPENGIWLCQNCAKLIDNDPIRYPGEVLRDWKAQAETTAIAEIECGTKPQSVDPSTEIELLYEKERIKSERHDYRLQVRLRNLGTEHIGQYQIDLEIPDRVVNRSKGQPFYVPIRSTGDLAFFRVSHINPEEAIFPGDTQLVMSIHYYMDHEIYINRGSLFDQLVRATLYRPGIRPFTLERRFGEFQNF